MVNYVLECCRGVSESYRYNLVLKVPIVSSESCFPLVPFLNPDIAKGYRKIQSTKLLGVCQSVLYLSNK